MSKINITKDVYYVGVRDYNRRVFDSLIPLPQGTTYNSYLIDGENPVVIDTVNPGFEELWLDNISKIVDIKKIKYLVMNHAEPDHAGSIPYLLSKNKEIKLIVSPQGKRLAQRFYKVEEERIIVVQDNQRLSLKDKTLTFILAPMLHWPETMFTYFEEGKVLFPCDFLGFHTSYNGLFEDGIEDLEFEAKSYYGEIMMPYSEFGKRALEKIKNLSINFIAPSHGPIYREPKRILDYYSKWTQGITEEKIIIIYVSMWKDIEKMVDRITEKLLKENIKFARYNLENANVKDLCADLVDSRGIIFGAPTVLSSIHPLGIYGAYLLKLLKPPVKYGAFLSSYGWADGFKEQISKILDKTKIEVVGEKIINGPAYKEDLEELDTIVDRLIEKVKNG